ncbi:MAG: Tyrosine-specific transport protein [Chlamydiia bacterium]|nr:Tyrosine-specific transport protein [Chlamydiia bacterium]
MLSESSKKVAGGALLVAGTAIGAGMLALPVVTAAGGFIPSCFIYLICYLFSVATGLLFLEVCYWMPQNANLVSMAYHILGPVGRVFAWILYIFLFYSLTIAYVSGGGAFVTFAFNNTIPMWAGTLIFTGAFATCVFIGTKVVDRVNFLLMIGLIGTFLLFIILGTGHVKLENIVRSHGMSALFALPVMFTSFSYQGIIPSLHTYLDRDPKKVRSAILIGTAIPFVSYIIWEFLILGLVPIDGVNGLAHAKDQGWNAVEPLRYLLNKSWLSNVGQAFAFCALTTSFLGVTLGLLDFLSDSLQIKKEGLKKLFLCALIYIPPFIIATINPNIFLRALGYAGGIGCVLLLGFMPTVMVWVGRYRKNYTTVAKQLSGGKVMLCTLFAFIAFELVIEIVQEVQKLFY